MREALNNESIRKTISTKTTVVDNIEKVLRRGANRRGRSNNNILNNGYGRESAGDDRLHRQGAGGTDEGNTSSSAQNSGAGIKYSLKPTNSSGLSTDNRAKTANDSVNKWVYNAEIFSYEENKLFHQKISEINQGSQAFEKNAKGEYMLPIENKIYLLTGIIIRLT